MKLEERARRAVEAAACTRCGAPMVPTRLHNQLITGLWRWVGERGEHFNLCANCGPLFREFLKGAARAGA